MIKKTCLYIFILSHKNVILLPVFSSSKDLEIYLPLFMSILISLITLLYLIYTIIIPFLHNIYLQKIYLITHISHSTPFKGFLYILKTLISSSLFSVYIGTFQLTFYFKCFQNNFIPNLSCKIFRPFFHFKGQPS